MIQTIVTCDRCNDKCSSHGTSYYTIDIYANDINPTNDNKVSTETAAQNVSENMSKVLGNKKHYCRRCKEEIEKFMAAR